MLEGCIDFRNVPMSGSIQNGSQMDGDMPGSPQYGVPGAPGKSAYEYAVEGGYTGTEEEFSRKLASDYSGGVDFETDETLTLKNGILSVDTIDQVVEDDKRPVTSGAVYQEFSKAVALLKTI